MKLLLVLTVFSVISSGFAKRIVCYYANWSRFGDDPFKIEDIDATLCTHVVYSFLGLDDNGRVKSADPWNDFGDEWTEGGLKRFLKLRNQNPSVKLLVGVGGWNEGPIRFQSIFRNPEKQKNFLESSLSFLANYKLDGLEIDCIYHSDGGNEHDKKGLTELLKDMKPRFQNKNYLLSIATSANPTIFANSYDIQSISKYVDLINVMSYDLHGSWDGKTGHVAPLYVMKGETPIDQQLNVEAVIHKYINSGASLEKLNVGLVNYGRTYTLVDPNNHGMNAPTRGAGRIEPLPYKTFCQQDKKNVWKKFRNEEQAVPYAVAGDQWVGYEDVKSLQDKVKFTVSRKLGGVTFWKLDYDDFKGLCGSGKYPLLRAVKAQLDK